MAGSSRERCAFGGGLAAALLVAGCGFAVGCSCEEEAPDSGSGTLIETDGASVLVPEGAVDDPSQIQVQEEAPPQPAPEGHSFLSPTYAFTPHGTTFETPVTITLEYTDSLAFDPEVFRLWDLDKAGWTAISDVTFSDGLAIFQTLGFSWYAVLGTEATGDDDDGGDDDSGDDDVGDDDSGDDDDSSGDDDSTGDDDSSTELVTLSLTEFFGPSTGEPVAVHWADIDSDSAGHELVIGNALTPNALEVWVVPSSTSSTLSWGSGALTQMTSMGLGEFGGDSATDAVCAVALGTTLMVWENDSGNGQLVDSGSSLSLTNAVNDLAVGDVNNDGLDDVALATDGGGVRVFLGVPGGGLMGPAQETNNGADYTSIDLWDYDSDGTADIVVGLTDTRGLEVWKWNDSGSATELVLQWSYVGPPGKTTAVAWGYFDSDGTVDIALGSSTAGVEVFQGTDAVGPGAYWQLVWESLTADSVTDVMWSDLNNDYENDLISVTSNGYPIRIYPNNGSGSFDPPWVSSDTAAQSSVDSQDYDGDGDVDLAIGQSTGGTVLLENTLLP